MNTTGITGITVTGLRGLRCSPVPSTPVRVSRTVSVIRLLWQALIPRPPWKVSVRQHLIIEPALHAQFLKVRCHGFAEFFIATDTSSIGWQILPRFEFGFINLCFGFVGKIVFGIICVNRSIVVRHTIAELLEDVDEALACRCYLGRSQISVLPVEPNDRGCCLPLGSYPIPSGEAGMVILTIMIATR